VLLSSLEGAAVTSIKIDGVSHEFSAVPGVQEDMTEIVLNVKKLVLRSHTRAPKTIRIEAKGKKDITAKDIITDDTVEVINPDLHIATLTKNVDFVMELEVQKGRGYVPADRNKKDGQPIGVIAVDSLFTPVKKVNFHVEDTRVGQMTDYDKLIVEVWTNGSISPKDAMLYASNILQRHLDVFVNFGKLPEEDIAGEPSSEKDDETYKRLAQPVSDLELSVRSANCLREANIKSIGELVKKTEAEMLKYRNFGKKSLNEITAIVKEMGLSFGMDVDLDKLKQYSGKSE
jgi:DNA-directed RNA polymerase subunit alpha